MVVGHPHPVGGQVHLIHLLRVGNLAIEESRGHRGGEQLMYKRGAEASGRSNLPNRQALLMGRDDSPGTLYLSVVEPYGGCS